MVKQTLLRTVRRLAALFEDAGSGRRWLRSMAGVLAFGIVALPVGASFARQSPTLTINPPGGSRSSPTLEVIINYSSNTTTLDYSSREIKLNNIEVTDSFTHTSSESRGTLTLTSGINNALDVIICDVNEDCAMDTQFYTWDGTAPQVKVSPADGYFNTPSVSVTIDWLDDVALDASTRVVTLDDSPLTVSYNGATDSARSVGTASLTNPNWDPHVLKASICDQAGNCSVEVMRDYIYDPVAPTISFSPGTGLRNSTSQQVTIAWGDNGALDNTSRTITLNGQSVKTSFNYNITGAGSAISTATLNLLPGVNTLVGSIHDRAGNLKRDSVQYTVDANPPTVSISPAGGTGSTQSVFVTVTWGDNNGLNQASREVRLRGSSVGLTDSWSGPTGGSTSGTIELLSGSNEFFAKICDHAGSCTTNTVNFVYDNAAPTVSISPAGGQRTDPSLAVTISWNDNLGLNASSRQITLRDTVISMGYSANGATAGTSSGTITLKEGSNTLTASICDAVGNCSTPVSATYTRNGVRPTAVITPDGGTFTNASLPISIAWTSYVNALDSVFRSVKLNGNAVPTSYTPNGPMSGTSTATINLEPGTNVLVVRIDDEQGIVGIPDTAIYTLTANTAPAITISPNGGTYSNASLPVAISWKDATGLQGSSRVITLNNDTITNSFGFTPAADSAVSTATISLRPGNNLLTARICDTTTPTPLCSTKQTTYIDTIGGGGQTPAQAGMIVDVASMNPGSAVDRSLCLTVSLGESTAAECGDLRVVHALPGVVHLNQPRQPGLIYNSAHANPYPFVQADVKLPASTVPDTVYAILAVDGIQRGDTLRWAGNQWTAGSVRRIAIGYDAVNDSTGVKSYTLEVVNRYGSTEHHAYASGELAVVNRATSYFGAGWWLAGLERLDPGTMTWVGGDGSIRQYASVGTNVWTAPNASEPDTIRYDNGSYVRLLKGGTKVYFNATGQHVRTVPRLGDAHATEFTYMSGELAAILLHAPIPTSYDFMHGTAQIDVISPDGRAVQFRRDSNGRITSIVDPDEVTTTFAYSGKRITTRTNRANVSTSFDYDTSSNKLMASRLDMGDGKWIADTLSFIESQVVTQAIDTARVRVLVNGPRTDVADTTAFYLDRFGAPRGIRNALGHTTTLLRGNTTYPALVTEVIHPNNFREQATYNSRGNIKTRTAIEPLGPGSANAVTRYEYANTSWPDFPTSIVNPESDSVAIGYEANTGNRIWQQDARGITSRVQFRYYDQNWPHMLRAIEPPGNVQADSIVYGGISPSGGTYGNLAETRSALGFVTKYHKDAAGRDTLIVSPINGTNTQRQRIRYDLMGRDTAIITIGPALPITDCEQCTGGSLMADSLMVRNILDNMGRPLHVERNAGSAGSVGGDSMGVDFVTTDYTYDNAGRKLTETNFNSTTLTYVYDPAGNVIQRINMRGATDTMKYDEVNRLKRRISQTVNYPSAPCVSGSIAGTIPCVWGTTYDALIIPAETAEFDYDEAGRLTSARNNSAFVDRTYYLNGLLKTDALTFRPFPLDSVPPGGEEPPDSATSLGYRFAMNMTNDTSYVISYTYDRNGRRTGVSYPQQLEVNDVTYKYTTWGALDSIKGAMVTGTGRDTYTFGYDEQGRPASLTYGGLVDAIEQYEYDDDGRRIGRKVGTTTNPTSMYDDVLTFDQRGKVTHVNMRAGVRESYHWYSGLGQVVASRWNSTISGEYEHEEFRSDAHGNTYWTRKPGLTQKQPHHKYHYDGGRLSSIIARDTAQEGGINSHREYDADGNVSFASDVSYKSEEGPTSQRTTRSYYNAEGKLVQFQRYVWQATPTSSNEGDLREVTRYDALGRRILLRTLNTPNAGINSTDAITRFIWDGDQLLAELRAPGGLGASLNAHAGFGEQFGRVIYTHGPGMDAPLAVIRKNHGYDGLITPFTNWRGQYERGSFTGTTECTGSVHENCIAVDWPAPKLRTYYDGPSRITGHWVGSLLRDQRDESGLLYRRNRYYDPQTGQFTQQDPIGLAGGLNLYGFGGGDPVNFSDPFGLNPCGPFISLCWRAAGFILAKALPFIGSAGRAAIRFATPGPGVGADDIASAPLRNANFAQRTFRETFQNGGRFAGQTIDDVAGKLRAGDISPADVPIDYIVREGHTLILNTRSAQALERAGVSRDQWNAINRTGQELYEELVTGQLRRNGLTSAGTERVTSSGK